MGLDWIAEEGLPQGRFGFVASRRFFLPRPLGRGHRPERKFPGFSESPEIGSCISFTEQQQVLEAALADRPGHLLCHRWLIVLQEGKEVQFKVRPSRVEVFRLCLLSRGLRLLEAVQI